MKYYVVEVESKSREASAIKRRIESLLARILPRANPDFEERYESVRRWWLETDANWVVHRELGFDEDEKPIVAGPLGPNRGIFTDHVGAPFHFDSTIEVDQFENAWREFIGKGTQA